MSNKIALLRGFVWWSLIGALLALRLVMPASAQGSTSGLRFNGTNQYVTFGIAPQLGLPRFTLETWFNWTGGGIVTSTGDGGTVAIPLISKGRSESDGNNRDLNYFLGIQRDTQVLVADFEDLDSSSNFPVTGNTVITPNIWYHVAATYDGSTWRLYLDGNLEATYALNSLTPRYDSIQHVALASALNSLGGASGFFQGTLDEPRIWNYARTQAQIQSTINQEIATSPGLVGRWSMNEGSGTVLNNSASSDLNGTSVGNPTWVTGSPFNLPDGYNPLGLRIRLVSRHIPDIGPLDTLLFFRVSFSLPAFCVSASSNRYNV